MCTQYNIKNIHNWLFIPKYTLNNYLRSWVIEYSIDTQNLKILCTQWYNRKYELIEHSITTQNCNLLSTQDWVLNNHLFLLGDWVLNNPKIEWTLPHALEAECVIVKHLTVAIAPQCWASTLC